MVENFTLETQAAVDVMICANQTVEMVEMAVHNMVLLWNVPMFSWRTARF